MAEYALAAVINLERRFKLALQLQNQKTWSSRFLIISTTKIEMLIPDYFSPELKGYRCLSELTVGILGIGQIGLSSAKLLRGFIFLKQTSATTSNLCLFAGLGCKVLGLVSKERTPTETDVVTQYFTKPQLPQLLSSVDYLINILPSTPDTDNILSRYFIFLLCHRDR